MAGRRGGQGGTAGTLTRSTGLLSSITWLILARPRSQPAASQRCDDSDMEGLTRSHHDSFYVLPPEEERLEVGSRHLKHRLSVISEVSEESSPASSPLTSPQRIISSLHSQTPPGNIRQSYQDDFLSSEEFR